MPRNTAALVFLDNSGIKNGSTATYLHLIITYVQHVEYKSGFIVFPQWVSDEVLHDARLILF